MNCRIVMFYFWWLLINGFVYYAEFDFFERFIGRGAEKSMIRYVALNCILTFLAIFFQMPGLLREFLHIAFLSAFLLAVLKYRPSEAVAPIVIVFTLSTFMEGISTALMRYLSASVTSPLAGNIMHAALTVVLAVLFFLALRLIVKRYGLTAGQVISSYLYILLLPSAFIVWLVRFGLGIDGGAAPANKIVSAEAPLFWTVACIIGAGITFFVTLNVFDKVITLSAQEMERALLDNRLREQRVYLAEAQKRDAQYRAFHHDINNHLLVFSGLLQEKKYKEAERYLEKLHAASNALLFRVSTGNAVLDVLLREKIGYAAQNNITVDHEMHIPPDTQIDAFDLCIIVANALDNAIQACLQAPREDNRIRITAKARRRFLVLEVTNPCASHAPVQPGTGLRNIQRTAEKYRGMSEFEQADGRFRLSVLLCRD